MHILIVLEALAVSTQVACGPCSGRSRVAVAQEGQTRPGSLPLESQGPAFPGRFSWTLHLLCFCDGPCKGDAGRDLALCVPPGACAPPAVAGPHAECQQLLGCSGWCRWRGQPWTVTLRCEPFCLAPARAMP